MLSNHEDVDSIFRDLGMNLTNSIQIFVIGGAALQFYNLKDATKDIDIICINQEERKMLIESAQKSGFKTALPEPRHKNLDGLGRIAIKGPHTVDIFAETITGSYRLTPEMKERAISSKHFGILEAKYTSPEDILIMKLIASRKNDIEDCAKIIMGGVDFEVVYKEIESQFYNSNDISNQTWITYLDQSISDLDERYHIDVPIADKISDLSNTWYEKRAKIEGI